MNIAEELRTLADRIEGSHIPKDEKDLRIEKIGRASCRERV